MFGGIKKQPAWGHRVARLFREVSRRVTNALKGLESGLTPEFPANPISLNFIEIRAARGRHGGGIGGQRTPLPHGSLRFTSVEEHAVRQLHHASQGPWMGCYSSEIKRSAASHFDE